MTTLDHQIREHLAEGDHEDWCDARTHAGCCDKGCNCFLGPANAAIVEVIDFCALMDRESTSSSRFADSIRERIASALGITQEATDG